ncbi:MAG TPA: phenylacetic acid degradation protein [Planctomycetaceae bacterium]|nr:phenylacetic acid degradation protein [Planctomycetaceae bacterium]
MKMASWVPVWFVAVIWVVATAAPARSDEGSVPSALFDYVSRPENVFAWQLREKRQLSAGVLYDVDLTSQRWQGIVWKHALQVYEPARIAYPRHVLLFVTGGENGRRPRGGDRELGMQLATMTGARVAMLFQVPNQPLLDGRKEDDLISETWLRYLATGDARWPLLFPMVKSAMKAMDAVEQLATAHWQATVEAFVITGASKRGWTSWLTAVADPRVMATAPIVIDVLNFQPQMQHQLDIWGEFSEQIHDYTSKGLIKLADETPREIQLRRMMDPFTYRQKLTLPKLIINGTNDRYWVVDATRFYWHELVGPKYLLQVPNAGHGLEGGRDLAMGTLAAFFRHVVSGRSMPAVRWDHGEDVDDLLLRIRSTPRPREARLWVARSLDRDFRDAVWTDRPMSRQGETYSGRVAKPRRGYVALFGQLDFTADGLDFSLSTLIRRFPENR